jgi:hypothetical protein
MLFALGIALISVGMPFHHLSAVLGPICAIGFALSGLACVVGFLHGRAVREFDRRPPPMPSPERLALIEDPNREITLRYPGWMGPLAASLILAIVSLGVWKDWGSISPFVLCLSPIVPLSCFGLLAGFRSQVILRRDTLSVRSGFGQPRTWPYSEIVNMRGWTTIAITLRDGSTVTARTYPFTALDFYIAVEARCGRMFGCDRALGRFALRRC